MPCLPGPVALVPSHGVGGCRSVLHCAKILRLAQEGLAWVTGNDVSERVGGRFLHRGKWLMISQQAGEATWAEHERGSCFHSSSLWNPGTKGQRDSQGKFQCLLS